MAGRGCTILIKLLGGANGQGETEDISLPVALHSPLEVLKHQLHQLVSIAPRDQVLILCELSDPERNSDRLLTGLDSLPLRECGIRNGSVLTLHAISVTAERKQRMMKDAFAMKTINEIDNRPVHSLETPITASDANHSYNGIIFDVKCKGPYEIEVFSVSIAGMLGRVQIFARDRPWEADKPPEPQTQHWWAHRDSVSRTGWEKVAEKVCRPSWDKPIEIRFQAPIIIGPHQTRAIYCHSGLPDDLGIQYQSYSKRDIVAEDEYICLLPGLGHTGSEPFDEVHGWYRSYRGLAGSVQYHMRWKGWHPQRHLEFPSPLRQAVKTMLLCNLKHPHHHQQHPSSSGSVAAAACVDVSQRRLTLASLPVYVIYHIMEFMHHDWFAPPPMTLQESSSTADLATMAQLKRRLRQAFASNSAGGVMQLLQQMGTGGLDPEHFMEMVYYYGQNGDDEDDDEDEEEEEEYYDDDDEEDDDDELMDDDEEGDEDGDGEEDDNEEEDNEEEDNEAEDVCGDTGLENIHHGTEYLTEDDSFDTAVMDEDHQERDDDDEDGGVEEVDDFCDNDGCDEDQDDDDGDNCDDDDDDYFENPGDYGNGYEDEDQDY